MRTNSETIQIIEKENMSKRRKQKMKQTSGKRQMKIKERQKQSKEKKIPKDSRKIFAREGERLIAIFLLINE